MKFKLAKGETIVTAYAERASGPGWGNSPVWVIVRGTDQKLRQECIQPRDQTAEMHLLYNVSEAAHASMCSAVETSK